MGLPRPLRSVDTAREDALLTAQLLQAQLLKLGAQGVATVGELRSTAPRALLNPGVTFLDQEEASAVGGRAPCMPRGRKAAERRPTAPSLPRATSSYGDELSRCLGTTVSVEGIDRLRGLGARQPSAVRAAQHAQVFARWLAAECSSGTVNDVQKARISKALRLLSALGWAPGE